jgi:hypothetical protein
VSYLKIGPHLINTEAIAYITDCSEYQQAGEPKQARIVFNSGTTLEFTGQCAEQALAIASPTQPKEQT